MSNLINNKKRKEKDVMKLIMSDYEVTLKDESRMDEFSVIFKGPKESPYEEGIWKIDVLLPEQYPYKSPSIGFSNKIFHPNIDEASGSVCLDVINQTWSPMYELINIFDVFLPQLLMYPNPSDPLNFSAAKLYLLDMKKYEASVKDFVNKHAKENLVKGKKETESNNNKNKEQSNDKIKAKNNNINSDTLDNKEHNDNKSEISEASIIEDLSEI